MSVRPDVVTRAWRRRGEEREGCPAFQKDALSFPAPLPLRRFSKSRLTVFPWQPLRWPGILFFHPYVKPPHSSTSLLRLAKVSAPMVLDKATINCGPVWRARGTKGPTRCPGPQTRLETNVTGPAQNRIIRPMSLNTFTYLRAHSAARFCFMRVRREGMNGGREGAGTDACDEK